MGGSHGGFYRRDKRGAETWGNPRVVGQDSGYLAHDMLFWIFFFSGSQNEYVRVVADIKSNPNFNDNFSFVLP